MEDPKKIRIKAKIKNKYLSQHQVNQLVTYVKNRADFARKTGAKRAIVDEIIILIFLNAGLRANELCNLNIRDLTINHGLNALRVRNDNGNVVRDINISSEIKQRLVRFVRLYRKNAKPNDPLLISERGNRFIYMSLYSKVKRIGEKAGIGKLHTELLRSTYLVRLYDVERDLRFVQQQAGHKTLKTTARYAKRSSGYKKEVENIGDTDFASIKSIHEYQKHSKKVYKCGGCEREILGDEGTKIDSGQILCRDCLKYFRKM